MKYMIILTIFIISILTAQELKIKADQFDADEKTGISTFEGKVNIKMATDELNATKVTIYTDEKHEPIKYIAEGNVSFNIETKKGSLYKGEAGRVIYLPKIQEYHFFIDVHLRQIDDKKEIIGEEVVLKTIEGKAYAKGAKKEPVIMIFKMDEDKK